MVKVNLWAFVGSIVCIVLFWIAGFSQVKSLIAQGIGVNPWYIILFGSLITLVLGLLGFAGGDNWFAHLRSIGTLIIASGLSVFSIAVIVLGHMFQFT